MLDPRPQTRILPLALRLSYSVTTSKHRRGASLEGAQYVGNGPSGQRGNQDEPQREAGNAAASYATAGRRKKPGAILADSMYGKTRKRMRISETRTGGKPIKIGRSSSNPGRLNIEIPDEQAFEAAVQAFEDMNVGWLREQSKHGVTESLGVFVGKESKGDTHWLGDVWWEDRPEGIDFRLNNSYSDGLVVEVDPKGYRSKLKREVHKYGKVSRIIPKDYLMRSLQAYLRGVQDGTNGKERVYASKERTTKAGTPSQLKALADIERMAKDAGRPFENRGGERSISFNIRAADGLKGISQPLLIGDVGRTGVLRLTAYERHQERKLTGSAAWSYLKHELLGESRAHSKTPCGVVLSEAIAEAYPQGHALPEALSESDAQVRAAERRWHASGAPDDLERWLLLRFRSGETDITVDGPRGGMQLVLAPRKRVHIGKEFKDKLAARKAGAGPALRIADLGLHYTKDAGIRTRFWHVRPDGTTAPGGDAGWRGTPAKFDIGLKNAVRTFTAYNRSPEEEEHEEAEYWRTRRNESLTEAMRSVVQKDLYRSLERFSVVQSFGSSLVGAGYLTVKAPFKLVQKELLAAGWQRAVGEGANVFSKVLGRTTQPALVIVHDFAGVTRIASVDESIAEAKKAPKVVEAAVEAWRLYLGSIGYVRPEQEERLTYRAQKAVSKAATAMRVPFVAMQTAVDREARKRGVRLPRVGQDI